jgi:hypothetical protein
MLFVDGGSLERAPFTCYHGRSSFGDGAPWCGTLARMVRAIGGRSMMWRDQAAASLRRNR